MHSPTILRALAPSGVLRVGIILSNFLLVSSRDEQGKPFGVAPDMAALLAAELGVPLQLNLYKNPGLLADAAIADEWDVGLIGAEPQRARTIAFTQPYAEIYATYLVPDGSPLSRISDVDAPGHRIAVSARAAYDLWLTDNLAHATLVRTDEPGLQQSLELFQSGGFDALAGLRPWLLTQAEEQLPGATVLDGHFTTVQQSIGIPRQRGECAQPLVIRRS